MPPVLSITCIVFISKVIISIVMFYNKDKMSQNLKERRWLWQILRRKSFIKSTRWLNKKIVFYNFLSIL